MGWSAMLSACLTCLTIGLPWSCASQPASQPLCCKHATSPQMLQAAPAL